MAEQQERKTTVKFLLILSLVLNIGLAGYIMTIQPTPLTTNSEKLKTVTNTASRVITKTKKETVLVAGPEKKIDWRMVESEDYKKYIENLRAISCPEETIRDIIIADVNKLFESRKQALKIASTNKFKFWKSGNMFAGMMDEEKVKQNQELNKEKRALLKELLGMEPEEKPDMAALNPLEAMLDFLPSGKQTQVMELMQTYQAKLMKTMKNGVDPDDMKQIQKVQKDMEAELAKILSPKELEDYQLRLSQTALVMRMQLSSFEPSEQEFRDIFKEKKKFDDEFPMMGAGNLDKAEKEKKAAAQKELNEKLKSILGETRFTEYQMNQDFAYQGMFKVAQKQGLPKDTAVKVFDMKKAAEDQAKSVRDNKALTVEQRTQALQGIRSETERSIEDVFGKTGFQK
ncbi:MAG: hypothetical protein ACR2H1_01405 [Limisphaerales bacterium]